MQQFPKFYQLIILAYRLTCTLFLLFSIQYIINAAPGFFCKAEGNMTPLTSGSLRCAVHSQYYRPCAPDPIHPREQSSSPMCLLGMYRYVPCKQHKKFKVSRKTIFGFCQYHVKVLKAFPVSRKCCHTVTTQSPIFCLLNPRFGLFWYVKRTHCFQNPSCRSQALLLAGQADCRTGHSQTQWFKKCDGDSDVRGINENKYRAGIRACVKGNTE